jgi:UDP-glucose 4-epimerase
VSRGLVWLVGRGGLLGSALVRALGTGPGTSVCWPGPLTPFDWRAPEAVQRQMDECASQFARAAINGDFASWTMIWAAGAGVVGTSLADLTNETTTLTHAVQRLSHHLRRLDCAIPGFVFLASSAGGVYGRCPDSPATERSRPDPISDYGREKLRQEERLVRWACDQGVSTLIGRIANLYGPGQKLDKPQGLISHLVRTLVLNQPAHVYVPLDTLRDYLHVDDCASAIVTALDRLRTETIAAREPRQVLKIFASEQPRSISSLLGLISQVTRRRPLIIHAARAVAQQQPRSLTFRSEVWRDDHVRPTINLSVGVSQVHRHLLEQLKHARLAPTPPTETERATRRMTPRWVVVPASERRDQSVTVGA